MYDLHLLILSIKSVSTNFIILLNIIYINLFYFFMPNKSRVILIMRKELGSVFNYDKVRKGYKYIGFFESRLFSLGLYSFSIVYD